MERRQFLQGGLGMTLAAAFGPFAAARRGDAVSNPVEVELANGGMTVVTGPACPPLRTISPRRRP
jgi:hypothetical protein